jgi:hypothetical protein
MASSEVFHSGLVSPSTLGMTTFLKDLGINAELIASMTAQGYMQNVETLVNVVAGSLKEGGIGGQSMMVWKDLIAKFVDDLKMLST